MSEPDPTRQSRGRYQSADQELWQMWRQGRVPDLHAFLESRPGLSPEERAAVASIDQFERWRVGQRVPAEQYIPLLGEGTGLERAACDIAYGEFLIREQLGEHPSIEEYKVRFPSLAGLLARQAEVHLAFSDARATPATFHGQTGPAAMPPDDNPLIPGYEIIEEIGRGGMGVVYKARQMSLDRDVALKVLRVRAESDWQALERMRREAIVTGRLSHSGIVAIFDAGQAGPCFYFAMELVAGRDLHRLVDQGGPLSPALCLEYLRQAAEALGHAHEAGLVHRDIKPSNLMVVPAASGPGRLKLLDLGLARQTGLSVGDEQITLAGSFMGTPDFVAPEQANDPRDADARSDLYGLGCTFFYAATGRTPYSGTTPLSKLLKHHAEEVPLVSRLRPGLPSRFVDALTRLMAKRPEDRFPTAASLIAALDDKGDPVAVPGPSLIHRLEADDWVKSVAFSPDGTVLACGGLDRMVRLWAAQSGRPLWARPQAASVLAIAFSLSGRWLAWGDEEGTVTVADAFTGEIAGSGTGHTGHVNTVAFHTDSLVISGSHDGTLRLWDVPTGRSVRSWPAHAGAVWGVSAVGGVAVSVGLDRAVRCWGIEAGEPRGEAFMEQPATCVALSPDGTRLLAGDAGGELRLLDASGSEQARVAAHAGRMTGVAWSPDGTYFVTCGRDKLVKGWAWPSRPLFTLEGHTGWALSVACGVAGLLASGGAARRVLVWRREHP